MTAWHGYFIVDKGGTARQSQRKVHLCWKTVLGTVYHSPSLSLACQASVSFAQRVYSNEKSERAAARHAGSFSAPPPLHFSVSQMHSGSFQLWPLLSGSVLPVLLLGSGPVGQWLEENQSAAIPARTAASESHLKHIFPALAQLAPEILHCVIEQTQRRAASADVVRG